MPDTVTTRARTAAFRIMRNPTGKKPVPVSYANKVADLVAEHWVEMELASISSGRLKVASNAHEDAWWLAKRLEWMTNAKRHHGQQAEERAHKTLRGLENGNLCYLELMEQTQKYVGLRQRHIEGNKATKERDEAAPVRLCDGRFAARRLTSYQDMQRTGRAMRNCLAGGRYFENYKKRLRNGLVQFVLLEDAVGKPVALIEYDVSEQCCVQVKGPENDRPLECREALIKVLGHYDYSVGFCSDLHQLAICDELVAAYASGEVAVFLVGGWQYEVATGVVAATQGEVTAMLRGSLVASGSELCIVAPSSDDEYQRQAKVRSRLRHACRDVGLRRACLEALSVETTAFCRDWFWPCFASKKSS